MSHPQIDISSVYPVLSPKELISNVVPLYKIPNPISCEILHQGINDSYIVTSERKKHLLRIYRKNWRSLHDIEFEIEALNYLHEKGAHVAYPIEKNQGGYITEINTPEGLRYAIITTFAEGEELKYKNIDDAAQYGKAVAKIHRLSDDFISNHARYKLDLKHLVEEPLKRIKLSLSHRVDDWVFLNNYASVLSKKIDESDLGLLDYGFCHGDFHGWNAHMHREEITFYDFDCCGFGLRAYDLAVFKWSARLRNKENEWWVPFLNAYRRVRPISEYDLSFVDIFISIRHIWLIGLHIETASDQDWLDDSYFDREIQFLKQNAGL